MKQKPKVKLVGKDGNAFFILARVSGALRKAGYSKEEIKKYHKEATSGDYNNLLRVTMDWCDCDSEEEEFEFEEEENQL